MKESLWILSLVFVFFACKEGTTKNRVLPILGNYDIDYKIIDGKEVADTIWPQMIPFTYLNQDSVLIDSKSMKGKIWIAEFFFTTCPTICPPMTREMIRLNRNTKDIENELQFISFTINPKHDTPSVLKRHKEKYKITAKNWQFFTGDETRTHDLGINHFMVFAGQDENSAGGYAHSGAFTLVDREGYVRGVYMGTDPKQVDQLEKDIRKLLKYEYGNN